jgi:hypothetical protein
MDKVQKPSDSEYAELCTIVGALYTLLLDPIYQLLHKREEQYSTEFPAYI